MNESVQAWMDRASASSGVLACGVRLSDRSFTVRSCVEHLPDSELAQAMRELWESIIALQENHIPAQRLRWSFENAQLRCLTRPGGVVAALLISNESGDRPELEQLLADFALTTS